MSTNFGLNDTLTYTEFEFDSFDCTTSYNQNYYTTDWPQFYVGKPLTNVAAIKILEVQIPFTYYVFNSTNNTFTLTEAGGIPGSATVTVPVGNYSSITILSALGTALSSASTAIGNSYTYTVSFSATTQLLTITKTGAGIFTLTFGAGLSDPGNTNPRLWLGFSGGANVGTATTLVSPSVIQLTGPNYIYINSRAIGSLINVYLPGNGLINPTNAGADGVQIARIPITSQPGGVTFWQDPVPLMWFETGNTTFSGSIDLFCTLGTNDLVPIQFNGGSFVVKMGVLTNTASHNDYLGGGRQNDRAIARTWPTGASPMRF